jgi:hypothetical protein
VNSKEDLGKVAGNGHTIHYFPSLKDLMKKLTSVWWQSVSVTRASLEMPGGGKDAPDIRQGG